MFQDEAWFGRINKPKYCWCQKGIRPSVPCHHIREYRYAYGAVEPKTGDSFFLIMPYCNTDCMNLFLQELSKTFADDVIVLACDGARWHKSKTMQIPDNIIDYVKDGVHFITGDEEVFCPVCHQLMKKCGRCRRYVRGKYGKRDELAV